MKLSISRRTGLVAAVIVLAGLTFVGAARADFPERSVTIIVPYPAGGATDVQARRLQEPLQKLWGQSVVIDNRSGSAGHIGSSYVSKAAPDGHTLLMNSGPTMAIGWSLYADLGYNPLKGLRSVQTTAFATEVIVANPNFSPSNLGELLEYARANPGKVTHGSPGIGTVGHMAAEMLKAQADIDMVHVPYKGSAPAVLALLKGEVDLYFANLNDVIGRINNGEFKGIGVAGAGRHPAIPAVQSANEAGLPKLAATPWYGVWAPAGTPDAIVEKLSKDILGVLQRPEITKQLNDLAQRVVPMTPAEMDAYMAEEVKKWGQVVAGAGLTKVK